MDSLHRPMVTVSPHPLVVLAQPIVEVVRGDGVLHPPQVARSLAVAHGRPVGLVGLAQQAPGPAVLRTLSLVVHRSSVARLPIIVTGRIHRSRLRTRRFSSHAATKPVVRMPRPRITRPKSGSRHHIAQAIADSTRPVMRRVATQGDRQ
jgi:hypothetical protein